MDDAEIYFYSILSANRYGLTIVSEGMELSFPIEKSCHPFGSSVGGKLSKKDIKNLRDFLNILLIE